MSRSERRRTIDVSTLDSLSILVDDKDPFIEWTNKCHMSDFFALINLVKAAVAVGYMKMPHHLSLSGLLYPTLLILFSVFLSWVASHVTIRTLHRVANNRGHDYICFPNVIKLLLDNGPGWCYKISIYVKNSLIGLIIISEILNIAVYVNMMSYKSIFFFGGGDVFRETIEVLLIVPLVIVCFIVWKMEYVTYISALGDLMLAVSLFVIIYLVIADEDESTFQCTSFTKTNVYELPSLMGTSIFAAHNFGVILIVHAHMKTPKNFLKTFGPLNLSYFIIVIFVLIAALLSCYKFASLADLPFLSDGEEVKWRTTVRIINSIIIFLTIPIHFQVCAEFTEHYFFYRLPEDYPLRLINCIVRFFYIITVVIIALFVPEIAGFYPVIGVTVATFGGIFLPALVELINITMNQERNNWLFYSIIATDIVLMFAGITYFALGIFVAIAPPEMRSHALSEKNLTWEVSI